jgi:hypothetical protein
MAVGSGFFAVQCPKIVPIREGIMECCGSTQLSLSNGRRRLNTAAGSMIRECSKNNAASSRRTDH